MTNKRAMALSSCLFDNNITKRQRRWRRSVLQRLFGLRT